jgi:hypothetical protein
MSNRYLPSFILLFASANALACKRAYDDVVGHFPWSYFGTSMAFADICQIVLIVKIRKLTKSNLILLLLPTLHPALWITPYRQGDCSLAPADYFFYLQIGTLAILTLSLLTTFLALRSKNTRIN